MTLFAHVSGEMEIITGQRAWARLNQGKKKNSGANHAELTVTRGEESVCLNLVGMDSLAAYPAVCARTFGCGHAVYAYRAQGLEVQRCIFVTPSTTPYDGVTAYLTTVTIRNVGSETAVINYAEGITANFTEIQEQALPVDQRMVKFTNASKVEGDIVIVHAEASADDPLLIETRARASRYDGFAPQMFLKAGNKVTVCANGSVMNAAAYVELNAGESAELFFLTGFAYDSVDAVLRRELIWHAYTLDAMATYSEIYGETKIPRGTIYDYDWGAHASARDHFQHGLPLVYYNAPLAKSGSSTC